MKHFLLLLAAFAVCAGTTPSALAGHITCGEVIIEDTTLDSDLVDCPGDGVVIGADGITLDLARHMIDGVGAQAGAYGVDNDGHDGVTVRRGRIQEFSAGVYFDLAHGGAIQGLTIAGTGSAVTLEESDSNVIERNTLGEGIALYGACDGNAIDRNAVVTAGTLVFIGGFSTVGGPIATGNSVTRNRLTGSGDSYGIFVSSANNTLIEGNDVRRHSGIGISVNVGGADNRILANVVASTGLTGIVLAGSVARTEVIGNRVRHSSADGIRLGSFTRDTFVGRNVAKRNGDDGIDSDTASATISRNVANFNFDLGIEAVAGVTDGGGNRAHGNGNPAQCVGVSCG